MQTSDCASPAGRRSTPMPSSSALSRSGPSRKTVFGPSGDQPARDVARGNDPVIGAVGNADLAQLLDHLPGKARRIGDEDDGGAACAGRFKGGSRLRKRIDAIMNDAPDIAEHHIIVTCYVREVFYPLGHSDFPICFGHGDIAKAQGDGKAFSSLPGQCEDPKRQSDGADGKWGLPISSRSGRSSRADGLRQSPVAPWFRLQSPTILRSLHNSGTKIRDCSH
ncbi:hypothetical protein ACVINH_002884 [Rhizobium anhuiense]